MDGRLRLMVHRLELRKSQLEQQGTDAVASKLSADTGLAELNPILSELTRILAAE